MEMKIELSNFGYYFDTFFLEYPIELIDNETIIKIIDAALKELANLGIENIVSKKEFMERTRSVPINRYVRVRNDFLSKYDKRVYDMLDSNDPTEFKQVPNPEELQGFKYDKTKPIREQPIGEGYKIDENVSLTNKFFHDSRYISIILTPLTINDKTYTIIKCSFNYKLKKVFPSIENITYLIGAITSKIFRCSGIYARAASFSRSEEYLAYLYHGEAKSEESGSDTCIGYLKPATLLTSYGIDARAIMELLDTRLSIHYSPDDLKTSEDLLKKTFKQYNIDRDIIYNKLNIIMDKWNKNNRDFLPLVKVIVQMLKSEATIEYFDDLKKSLKDNKLMPKKIEQIIDGEYNKIAGDIASLLAGIYDMRKMIYQNSEIRDFYVKIKRR